MWYAFTLDACIGSAPTKKELLTKIRTGNKDRCKRIETGSYEYESKDDDGYWYTHAYIFQSDQIAIENGFRDQLRKYKRD